MAEFNSVTLNNCITIGELVAEYRRLKEEIIPTFEDTALELRHTYPDGKLETIVNRIMADAIADMAIARDVFKRHDAQVKEICGPDHISYVKEQGLV